MLGMKTLACLLLVFGALAAGAQRPVEEFATAAGSVKITPIRHASLMIAAGGQVKDASGVAKDPPGGGTAEAGEAN